MTLGDLIESISHWGTVNLIQRDHDNPNHHRIHINFKEEVNLEASYRRGVMVLYGGANVLISSPLRVLNVEKKMCLSTKSMCVDLFTKLAMELTPLQYERLVNHFDYARAFYYKVEYHNIIAYRFHDAKWEKFTEKDMKRVVLMWWLQDCGREILRNGLYLDGFATAASRHFTKEEVVQFETEHWETLHTSV